jgi:hypothetical protein
MDPIKLPILLHFAWQTRGRIEKNQLTKMPKGHFNAVQEQSWMDCRVWTIYATELLQYEIEGPSVLLLDNFDSHVFDEGQRVIVEETCSSVCPVSGAPALLRRTPMLQRKDFMRSRNHCCVRKLKTFKWDRYL